MKLTITSRNMVVTPAITKPAMNHRLKKIVELAMEATI